MTSISLLVINYRSAHLAAEAIRTARGASSRPLQVVVIDNSSEPAEADALRELADVMVAAPRNLGYAGGINAGRRYCDGEVIVASNPDIRFGERAIDHLVDVDAAVAGPALFWDDAHQWILPPAELQIRGHRSRGCQPLGRVGAPARPAAFPGTGGLLVARFPHARRCPLWRGHGHSGDRIRRRWRFRRTI
jgi:hypothetical protein